MSTKRIRYHQSHWQKLVDNQAQSDLSGAQFCREHQIAYASFMSWRKRLGGVNPNPGSESPTTFVELTAPPVPAPDYSHADTAPASAVCVELTLGTGIELRITRSA